MKVEEVSRNTNLQKTFRECVEAVKREFARENQEKTIRSTFHSPGRPQVSALHTESVIENTSETVSELRDVDKRRILEMLVSDHEFLIAANDFIF